MNFLIPSLFISILLSTFQYSNTQSNCQFENSNHREVSNYLTVEKEGSGDFTSIQDAINYVPDNNQHWIRIKVSPGKYLEKVEIPVKKTCIFLEGAGSKVTSIEWGDHVAASNSSTFTSYADDIVVKGIAFKNDHNLGKTLNGTKLRQAVAARIKGDRCAFVKCAFFGVQDTLWDDKHRHYFHRCYIEGAVDFIFGKAQSIYKKCVVSVNIGQYAPRLVGYITAQKREWAEAESGFVFKQCKFTGIGKAYLGRAWGPFSTVIIYRSKLSNVVDPRGWNAWDFVNHEANFTYAEAKNKGPGADTSKRVPWEKKLNSSQLTKFLDNSYINDDGWLGNLPIHLSP